ncbi:PilZ domain-containing protein [Desulfocicer vacuolatum DSM 3385]|uniref:PilZ domain-containing protein n=1 Tax=Desulfocicer vacuolatum DSM 3385 TaxID=1121400 RepID=A0A1W2B812_9BACT|nr:PilZ domain-containing protein [Desulfocicer vacuolatum]SMC68920.1 PilZ domain-containing protein [Desulfocicer vacuolatum DSM 3385]
MIKKVYVSNDKKATFKCPECGLIKEKDVSKFMGLESAVKIKCKCSCGHSYPVIFERRQHIRKDVNFSGTYVWGKEHGTLLVKNISHSGMCLKMTFKTALKVGDRFVVKFILGENSNSEVEKEVIVRGLKHPMMGVEFASKDHYGKFGAYLLYDF